MYWHGEPIDEVEVKEWEKEIADGKQTQLTIYSMILSKSYI
jgi:hypothetical protein